MPLGNIEIDGKHAEGFVSEMGNFNLVYIKTDVGMIGCGAFDVTALDSFGYPAAKISGVATIDDLLNGTIKLANENAKARGITEGMTGREAVALL